MKYYELKCKAYLKKDINFLDSFEIIAKYINFTLLQAGQNLNCGNSFKYYVFSGFNANLEGGFLYKAGEYKNFYIRSPDEKIIDNLSKKLRENTNNLNFLVTSCTKTTVAQFRIKEIYSATPVITTMENGRFWTNRETRGMELLKFKLENNLAKKFELFYKEKLSIKEDFIRVIQQKNIKPQNIQIEKNGKKIKFFGNKFSIIPHDDEISQKLAFMALSCGLGEKNSYGGGFCLGKKIY